jgi:hypothetical protein
VPKAPVAPVTRIVSFTAAPVACFDPDFAMNGEPAEHQSLEAS